MNLLGWAARRAATLACGEGPRRLIPLGEGIAGAALLLDEPGGEFPAPDCARVTPELRPAVAAWPLRTCTAPRRQVWSLRHAGLYDDDGAIYDIASRRAFTETLLYWNRPPHRHPALALRRALPVQKLAGLTVFLGGLGGQTFYHFLIENAPKLALLRPWLQQAGRVVVQGYLEANKTAWLRHLGFDLPIEWLRPLGHYHCEQLVFCPPLVSDCRPNPGVVATLRQLARVGPAAKRTRRIWSSRLQDHVRRMPWEAELIQSLPPGWEVVDFSRLTPPEVVALGRECGVFAGLHGAAFANLAVWPAGGRVLEVYTQPHEPWYPGLSLSAGHVHEITFEHDPARLVGLLERLAA